MYLLFVKSLNAHLPIFVILKKKWLNIHFRQIYIYIYIFKATHLHVVLKKSSCLIEKEYIMIYFLHLFLFN